MDAAQFWKGMGAGMLLGACVGMAALPKASRRRRIGKAARTMGRLIEELGSVVRL